MRRLLDFISRHRRRPAPRSPRRVVLALLLGSGALLAALPARADVHVVVNAANPLRTLTQTEVRDLFTGRSRAFGNGDFALAFDLPRDSATRNAFYLALTGMSPAQINSYWARLMFTGQTMPPQAMPSEQAMLEVVRRNASAIGYLSQEPTDKGLRTVLVIKTAS